MDLEQTKANKIGALMGSFEAEISNGRDFSDGVNVLHLANEKSVSRLQTLSQLMSAGQISNTAYIVYDSNNTPFLMSEVQVNTIIISASKWGLDRFNHLQSKIISVKACNDIPSVLAITY